MFEVGDLVKTDSIVDGGTFTKDRGYEVMAVNKDAILVVDNRGEERWWYDISFQLHTKKPKLEKQPEPLVNFKGWATWA